MLALIIAIVIAGLLLQNPKILYNLFKGLVVGAILIVGLLLLGTLAHAETVIKTDYRCRHLETMQLWDQLIYAHGSTTGFVIDKIKSGECSESPKIGTSVRVDQRFEYLLNGKTEVCIVPTGSSEPCQWVSSEIIK